MAAMRECSLRCEDQPIFVLCRFRAVLATVFTYDCGDTGGPAWPPPPGRPRQGAATALAVARAGELARDDPYVVVDIPNPGRERGTAAIGLRFLRRRL